MSMNQQIVRRLVRLESDLSELLSMEQLGRHTVGEAASPDSASDDNTAGFTIGSLWYRSGCAYTCTDSTAGAAVWTNITDGAGFGNTLAGLSDTDTTGVTACDVLMYDSVATAWTACNTASDAFTNNPAVLRADANGNIGASTIKVNTATELQGWAGFGFLQVDSTVAGNNILIHKESADANSARLELLKRRSGWGVLSDGDRLGTI